MASILEQQSRSLIPDVLRLGVFLPLRFHVKCLLFRPASERRERTDSAIAEGIAGAASKGGRHMVPNLLKDLTIATNGSVVVQDLVAKQRRKAPPP